MRPSPRQAVESAYRRGPQQPPPGAQGGGVDPPV